MRFYLSTLCPSMTPVTLQRTRQGDFHSGQAESALKNQTLRRLDSGGFLGSPSNRFRLMLRLTWSQVAAWRVRRHHLDQRAPAGSMLEVARRLCGLHAQVLSSALLTVWARVEEVDRRAVHRALWEDRTLVKTWAMRGTLHLLPTGDLPLWQAALSTRRRYRKPALWRRFALTLVELDRLTEATEPLLMAV